MNLPNNSPPSYPPRNPVSRSGSNYLSKAMRELSMNGEAAADNEWEDCNNDSDHEMSIEL